MKEAPAQNNHLSSPVPYVGATFVKLKISTGPTKQYIHRKVTVRFRDGKERTVALTTLRQLGRYAGSKVSLRMKQAAQALGAIVAAADAQVRENPELEEADRRARRVHAQARVQALKKRMIATLRDSATVLEPEDFDGEMIDVAELARLAVAERIMES